MPQPVEIADFGTVEFPDDFTPDQITEAIERDILPTASRRNELKAGMETAAAEGEAAGAAARGAERDEAILGGLSRAREFPAQNLNRLQAAGKMAGIVPQDARPFDIHTPLVPAESIAEALRWMTPHTWDQETPESRKGQDTISEGVREGIANTAAGFTTPTLENALLPVAGAAPAAARGLGLAFVPGIVGGIPEQGTRLGRASVEGTARDVAREATELGASAAIGGHILGKPLAQRVIEGPPRTTPPPIPRNERPGTEAEKESAEAIDALEELQRTQDAGFENVGTTTGEPAARTIGDPNAIPVPGAEAQVLRGEGSEVGLPKVGEGDAQGKGVAEAKGEAEAGGQDVLPPLKKRTPEVLAKQGAQAAENLTIDVKSVDGEAFVRFDAVVDRQDGQAYQFTIKRPGTPTSHLDGITFDVPVDATPAEIQAKMLAKVDEFTRNPPKRQMSDDDIEKAITAANEALTGKTETLEEIKAKIKKQPIKVAPEPPPEAKASPPAVVEPAAPAAPVVPPVTQAAPVRRSRRGTERPPDIRDYIDDLLKTSFLNYDQAVEIVGGIANFRRLPPWFKNRFRKGARDIGSFGSEVADTYGAEQYRDNPQAVVNDFLGYLARRQADRQGRTLEGMAQQTFETLVGGQRGEGRPEAGEPVDVDTLSVGDRFRVDGVDVVVRNVDADGFVDLRGGKGIGDFRIAEGVSVVPDKGSYKVAKPKKVTKEEAQSALDDLREERGDQDVAELVREWNPNASFADGKILNKAGKEVSPRDFMKWVDEREVEPFDLQDRAEGREKRGIFDETDEELNARFSREAEPRPGEDASVRYKFRTYDEFKKWMDERFGEGDLEGMTLGFKDSPSDYKVKYIRENRGGDPVKKEWLSHIATGSPLSTAPPPPRTTPRPPPAGMTGPNAPKPPPARPGQPPPPPRTPTPRRPFSTMAAVQLLKGFGSFPRINKLLREARGSYNTVTKQVSLKDKLSWDPKQLLKTLAHEIGHFIDLAISPEGKNRGFAQRWQPLRLFKDAFQRKEIRKAAVALSMDWRGPFSMHDRYRNSAEELFADAISALFMDPEWVNQKHPLIHDTFQKLLDDKPNFKAAYDSITQFIETGSLRDIAAGQLEKGWKKSIEEFANMEPPDKLPLSDAFRQWVVSKWFRAFEKEGHPSGIGDRITDQLEDSNLEGMRRSSIIASRIKANVEPFLKKIKGGGEAAHMLFSRFLFAGRIVNERRLAGKFIEQNPDIADQLFNKLINWDPELRAEFGADVRALAGTGSGKGAYDLAARIFQRIHDLGPEKVKQANRIASEFDSDLDGAMMAFNVRGKLLNPSGFTDVDAKAEMRSVVQSLTPDEQVALATAVKNYFDIVAGVMREAYDMGLISDKNWKQLIEPNLYNYVPFAVLDYWDGRVSAGIKPQAGTAKDIADPFLASQMKMTSMHNWMQRQMQTKLLAEAYRRGGYQVTVGERLRGPGALEALRKQNTHDSTSRLPLWKDGKMHVVEFPDDVHKTFEQASDRPSFIHDLAVWANGPFGKVSRGMLMTYTTLSPSFLFWRNLIRDSQTAAQRLGYGAVARQTGEVREAWRLSRNYANVAFGEAMLPEVEAMVANRVLPPPQTSRAFYSDKHLLQQLLLNNGLTAMQVSRLRPQDLQPPKRLQETFHKMERFVTSMEALSKIQTYRAAKKAGLNEGQAAALGRRGGIPNPAIGGTYSGFLEAWLPWTRVHVQGLRSTIDVARDPALNKAFAARVAAVEFAPRLARMAIASNLVGRMLNPSNQDDTSWKASMGEFFRRVSPYKMALDNVIPLGWHDPRTGMFYPLNHTFGQKSSEIPKHWEAVSFRVPSSEEGKLWGSLLYGMVSGVDKDVSRAGRGIGGNFRDWLFSQGLPQVTPALETTKQQFDLWVGGRNPTDTFRGQPVANEEMFKAGGLDRIQANMGALANQFGDLGAVASLIGQTAGMDPRAFNPTRQRIDKPTPLSQIPIAKSMLAFDNYAQYRDRRNEQITEERDGARARLLMSDDTRQLYDYYNKFRDKADRNQLDEVDMNRYYAARSWYRYVWGQRDDSNKLYSRALNAVGDNGSAGAKATVRRDLEEASRPFVENFKAAPTLK